MPFKSKAQMRYLYAKHPEIAKEFARKTSSTNMLPNKVAKVHKKVKEYHERRGK